MSISGKVQLDNLIPEIMSEKFYPELRSNLPMASFFERMFEGEIKNKGDKVLVNQINAPVGEIISDDTQGFSSEALSSTQFYIEANKIAVASYEITDLGQLQSISFENEMRQALVRAVAKNIEDQIVAALIPSAAAPDHILAPTGASLAAVDVANMKKLLSVQNVPYENRALFLDPEYHSDLIQVQQFAGQEYVAGRPTSSGAFTFPLYGFSIVEDRNLAATTAYACHSSALQLVMQQEMLLKVSDMHPLGKFGYKISASVVFGLKLFDNLRLVKYSG